MKNWKLFFILLVAMLVSASVARADSKVYVIGVVSQPDEAYLNQQGIAWVGAGMWSMAFPREQDWWVKNMYFHFALEGNESVYVDLLRDGERITSRELIRPQESVGFSLIRIPGRQHASINLLIGYKGKPEAVVPKVKVTPLFDGMMVCVSKYEGCQYPVMDTFFPPDEGDTIVLKK